MTENQVENDPEIPEDLATALRQQPEAAAIWQQLSTTHQRAHIRAIVRVAHSRTRADLVDHTVAHLLEHHAH